MKRADNTSFLAQANIRRHEAALAAARHAIEQLRREGKAVTYAAVAHTAGVSRPWLYRQDQIRSLISQLRDYQLPPPRSPRNVQPLARSASGSTPPMPRSPGCEPRTDPSATSSPATSASSEHRTARTHRPARHDPATSPAGLRQLHVHTAEIANYQA